MNRFGSGGSSAWLFRDREDAGRQLASLLERYGEKRPVVLGLPRGGVPVAAQVAKHLHALLDVLPVRKLGAPSQPEYGIGAISLGGTTVLGEDTVRQLHISQAQLAVIERREEAELERQLRRFRGNAPLPALQGRTVIIVDDGLATGVSALAAIRATESLDPQGIVLAAPVCARDTATAIRSAVADLVCVACPADFYAVGYWYEDFRPTTDETVIELLRVADARVRETELREAAGDSRER